MCFKFSRDLVGRKSIAHGSIHPSRLTNTAAALDDVVGGLRATQSVEVSDALYTQEYCAIFDSTNGI